MTDGHDGGKHGISWSGSGEPTPPTETRWCITCEKWMPIKHDHPAPTERVETSADELRESALALFIDERQMVAKEWGIREEDHNRLSSLTLDGIDAEANERIRIRLVKFEQAAVAPSPAGESQELIREMLAALKLAQSMLIAAHNTPAPSHKWWSQIADAIANAEATNV